MFVDVRHVLFSFNTAPDGVLEPTANVWASVTLAECVLDI
jgi:hypothetical protein